VTAPFFGVSGLHPVGLEPWPGIAYYGPMLPWEKFQRAASMSVFNRSTGMVSSGQGMTGDENLAAMIMLVMLGTFAGVLFGMLASNVLRFVSMHTGKSLGPAGWTIAGSAVLGAAISALLVFTAERE